MHPDQLEVKKAMPYPIKSANSADGALITDVDLGRRIVTGFANTALYFDSDDDIFLPGVNEKSIKEHGPASSSDQKIIHLSNHQWLVEKQPGMVTHLEEKEITYKGRKVHGTYFETRMSNTQYGTDMLINYQENVYNQHSEGFQYLDGFWIDSDDKEQWTKYLNLVLNPKDMEAKGYAFVWKQVRYFEHSTVVLGANALTPYLGVKSGNKESMSMKIVDRLDLLQKQLRNGKQSDECLRHMEMEVLQLKQLMTEIFAAAPSKKDILKKDRQDNDTLPQGINIKQLLNTMK